jgi:recombination protein RecA
VAAPFKTAEFDIMYNEGISYTGDLLNVASEHGVVKKGGAWYNYKDMKLGQGFEASKKFLKDNPKITQEIAKELKETIKKEEMAAAAE